ncbi:hypothetical protein ACMG4P_08640 [Pseudovibrio denitrificans]|uniref:hypothetical protein n=1 Tax=Pseudovibrio denitrificans TaxID=258256 RepID=UPI0039BF61F2
MKVTGDFSFTDIVSTASKQNAVKSKSLLSTDKNTIYTTSRWKLPLHSAASLKTHQDRVQKGLHELKAAIDREFGHLSPERSFSGILFASLKMQGHHFTKGAKVEDLSQITKGISQVINSDQSMKTQSLAEADFGKLPAAAKILKYSPGSYVVFKPEHGSAKIRFKVEQQHMPSGRKDERFESPETEAWLNSKNQVVVFEGLGRVRQTILDNAFSTTLPRELGGVPDRKGVLEYSYAESYLNE